MSIYYRKGGEFELETQLIKEEGLNYQNNPAFTLVQTFEFAKNVLSFNSSLVLSHNSINKVPIIYIF